MTCRLKQSAVVGHGSPGAIVAEKSALASIMGVGKVSVWIEPGDSATTGWTVRPVYQFEGPHALHPELMLPSNTDLSTVKNLAVGAQTLANFQANAGRFCEFRVPAGARYMTLDVISTPGGSINYQIGSV